MECHVLEWLFIHSFHIELNLEKLFFVEQGNWKTWQKTLGVLRDEKQQQTQPIVSTSGGGGGGGGAATSHTFS